MARTVKTLKSETRTKPGRAPLVEALEEMRNAGARTFQEVESTYLGAMNAARALGRRASLCDVDAEFAARRLRLGVEGLAGAKA